MSVKQLTSGTRKAPAGGFTQAYNMAHTGHCGLFGALLKAEVCHVARSDSAIPEVAIAPLVEHLGLTRRQAEVLHWVAEGKTNSEIGAILSCSFFTVKNHLKGIFRHLGVPSRTAAAGCAYRAHIAAAEVSRSLASSPPAASPAPPDRKIVEHLHPRFRATDANRLSHL